MKEKERVKGAGRERKRERKRERRHFIFHFSGNKDLVTGVQRCHTT